MSTDGTHRSSRLVNFLIVAAWIAVAVIANLAVVLAPGKSSDAGSALLSQDSMASAASSRIGQAFPGTGTNAVAYLVVDGPDTLGPADQSYYDAAVNALRADSRHIGSVLDWWSDPLTVPLGTGSDGHSAMAMVWLVGQAGSTQARESLQAAQSVVHNLPASAGLRARVVGPTTSSSVPAHMTVWQGAVIVLATAVIAVLLLLWARRSLVAAAVVLLTAGLSLAVAWPLAAALRAIPGQNISVFTVFSATLAAVLTIGAIAASTMLVARPGHAPGATAAQPLGRSASRDNLAALAMPAAGIAILTAPLLLARTPALHGVGVAALGVVMALAASLTLLPALIGLTGPSRLSSSRPVGARRSLPVSIPRTAVVAALVLAVCAVPVIGMQWGIGDGPVNPAAGGTKRVLPWQPLPDVVMLEAKHDLSDPAGLIAIDQVSHRLMEIPGVRRVESAAWPAGVPWTDASLTATAGKLSDELDRGAGSFMPQVRAIKTLGSIVDQMSGAVDELDRSVTAGLAGAAQIQQNVDLLISGTKNIKGVTVELSGYLDPVRGWMGDVPNCPGDMLCVAAGKVIDPVDRVVDDVKLLTDGADRIAAVSRKTVGAFSSAPQVVAQMRSALAQLQSFVPNLETTIENTLPQLVQVSAFLKNLRLDFANTGQGGFYLSGKALADPSYQPVRQSMFSADGTATRLLVFSEGNLGLDASARAQQLETAAGKAMKYGSLEDAEITVNGAAQVATDVRGSLTHDAVLLAATMLAAVVLVSMWRGALTAVVMAVGLLAAYLAALGISTALWQYLAGREIPAAVPLVSFAILAACGLPYLLDRTGTPISTEAPITSDAQPADTAALRNAGAPLAALTAVFGLGLVLVSAGSLGALSQIGTVVLFGVAALTVLARVCIPAAMQDRADRTTAATEPVAQPD
ncbi:MMPL family transporter [Mycobacterium marinum]|uniref:MMPL family transporter n=1 Tax=Mycobacterium marinum TaxID=1781 RepID=UPI000B96E8CC|nr:MMPL family transporter [Mycobacterium marinum]MDC9016415.1 MMPL family transporter [Mycobacterium marinum]